MVDDFRSCGVRVGLYHRTHTDVREPRIDRAGGLTRLDCAMTEKDARAHWCPFARTLFSGASVNRGANNAHRSEVLCVASACMAWRWRAKDNGECGLARPESLPL
jgi:hypothetical protein